MTRLPGRRCPGIGFVERPLWKLPEPPPATLVYVAYLFVSSSLIPAEDFIQFFGHEPGGDKSHAVTVHQLEQQRSGLVNERHLGEIHCELAVGIAPGGGTPAILE